jgi:hypothetical protein
MATITITSTATAPIRTRIEPAKKNGPHIGGPFF